MSFDPRQPHARLLVDGALGKQHATFALDTGVVEHLVSPELAKAAHVKRGPEHAARDVHGQSRVLQKIVGALDVPGVLAPVAPLYASDLTELADVGSARVGGILCPQDLVSGDDALRIDVPRGTLEQLSSKDAFAPSSDRALLLADVPRDDGGDFLVTARVGDHDVVLVVDTGAPTSTLFIPPDGTLPEGAYGTSTKRARLELGRVRRELMFEVLEPMVDPNVGGLLGLDLLRDCTLAMTASRLRVTCDDKLDLGVAAPPTTSPAHDVCFVDKGPCLRELVAGDYRYAGDKLVAHVDRRGRVTFKKRAGGEGKRTTREERAWLMDATRGLRSQLDRQASLTSSFDSLPWLLGWVWTRYAGSQVERRALLFRLWSECAADPSGERARRVITAYVREVAPAGSPDAYTTDELDVLNAGRPTRFEPYEPEAVDVP